MVGQVVLDWARVTRLVSPSKHPQSPDWSNPTDRDFFFFAPLLPLLFGEMIAVQPKDLLSLC
jgi:hypothetical protein